MPHPITHYTSLSVDELIHLLEHAHEHQAEAIVAAWGELDRRGISRREILDRRRALAVRTERHRISPRRWVHPDAVVAAPDTRHAHRMKLPWLRTEWILTALTVIMLLIALLQLLGLFESGILLLRPGESVAPFTIYVTVVGSVAAVFCCLAALRLWQGRRIGWVLSVAFLTFQVLTPAIQVLRYTLFGTSVLFEARTDRIFLHDAVEQLGFGVLLYGPPLYGLLIWRVRRTFGVDHGGAVRTVLIASAVLLAQQLLTLGN